MLNLPKKVWGYYAVLVDNNSVKSWMRCTCLNAEATFWDNDNQIKVMEKFYKVLDSNRFKTWVRCIFLKADATFSVKYNQSNFREIFGKSVHTNSKMIKNIQWLEEILLTD